MTKMDIGDMVAASMQDILASDRHQQFFKKAEKCCTCTSCGKDCPCKGKCGDCSMCGDMNHVHDDSCACGDAKMASAINEIMDTLSKVSAIQEELGLPSSALSTLHAMNAMVDEMTKIAQGLAEDKNEVKAKDLIDRISDSTDSRRDWHQFADEFPEEWALLKKRIDESHQGVEPSPTDLFDYVGPEAADTLAPEEAVANTEIPPESLVGARPLPAATDQLQNLTQTLETEVLPLEHKQHGEWKEEYTPYGAETETMPPKGAFERLDLWLKKAQFLDDDGLDFEDETDPTMDNEEVGDLPELFGLEPETDSEDLSGADDLMWASDLDEELENGDFLELPEDRDEGFDYSGSDKHKPSWMEEMIRLPGGDLVNYDTLSPQDKLEHEMGAGLHERLDIDPDQLSYDDLRQDEIDPESHMHSDIGTSKYRELTPEDDDWNPNINDEAQFWTGEDQ